MGKIKGLVVEFKEFMREYKILGLAIALVMGLAANQMVKSLVDNIIMPIVTPFIPGGAWQQAVLNIGPIALSWGKFLGDVIYFLIIAIVIFLVAKFVMKEEKVSKK